ncbi:MAG: NAD(P)/FAD-dependent oxidoreductase [Desulfobacterium sp.]|nr:NAD(P)/FAD-dependent oxidoreductase [Desulfobacterium sp.]
MVFYDTVIIGSGVSGMSAGILLAKSGRRVLVLEQNKKPGGLMQTFVRKSTVFPTGVHKLGALGPGEILRHYFSFLGVFSRLNLVPMDDSGYEQFVFPTSSFTVPRGYTALFNALVDAFPREEKAITAYLRSMTTTVRQFPLYNLANPGPVGDNGMDSSTSIHSHLLELGCSEALIKVLTANNPLHGMTPEECPAIIHFLVTDSFLNSSWRVDEAKTPLAKAFTDAFTEAGGHLRCSARVDSLNCDSSGIKGVRLTTGEEIACNEAVFTGHPQAIIDLCPGQSFRPAFRNRIQRAENTTGIFGLAAQWMGDDCPFALGDVYLYPAALPREHPKKSIYLSGLPGRQGNAWSMTALTAVSQADTRRLTDLKRGDRDGYLKAKEAMATAVVESITDRWGDARNKIQVVATYTPLTFNRYTLSPLGTAYGIKKSAETFWKNQLNPVTRIKGLFLAGQSLTVSGVLGALISSVQACMAMEGMGSLVQTITDFNGSHGESTRPRDQENVDDDNNRNPASPECNQGMNQ